MALAVLAADSGKLSAMRYAEVALNVPVKATFTYHIPPALDSRVALGSLARVEFGVAMQPGVVLGFSHETEIPKTKPLIELLDPQPVLSPQALELARWLSRESLAPIGACVWLMLPPGFTGKSDRQYSFLMDALQPPQPQQMNLSGERETSDPPLARKLLDHLRLRGPKRLRQLKSAFPKAPLERELASLETAGMIRSQSVLAPPAAREKLSERVIARYAASAIDGIVKQLRRPSRQADLLEIIASRDDDALGIEDALSAASLKSRASLNRLIDAGLVFIEPTERGAQDLIILEAADDKVRSLLCAWRGEEPLRELLRHILAAEPGATRADIQRATGASAAQMRKLQKTGAIEIRAERVFRDSLRDFDFVPSSAPDLTPDQQAVWDAIKPALRRQNDARAARFLLHGVTGSGKTEIYLRAIAETLAQGRQAIFLVPEIALTPQTIRRVAERFPGQVALVHGSLPIGERYDTWQRARQGDAQVVVGTRSALFTPLPRLSLIILDEEHDTSYKQGAWMNPPHYHARDTAAAMMQARGGTLILGSATPDLGSYYRAQSGHYTYLRLPKRIMGHRQRILGQARRIGVDARYQPDRADALHIALPPVTVVDMRAELRSGNSQMFSRELQTSLRAVLDRGEQAIMLLNRRGQATYVFCRDCGYALTCQRCDSPMTWHGSDQSLHCHHCGARQGQPQQCPQCASRRIRYFGAGTQQVELALKQLLPAVRSLRWDTDTASKPQMHDQILRRFIDGEADVIIGTQMITKGLDLPLVTLVGVVSADLGLALPDFRAGERVFQLLTQVAGRAGRGVLGGKVVLQTYQPGHYVIQTASRHDYEAFYHKELAYRRQLGYPPFRRMARIVFSYRDPLQAQRQAQAAAQRLREILHSMDLSGTSLIGPAPCFFARIDRHYRWQLLLRGPNPRAAIEALGSERGWQIDLDPSDLL